MSRPIELTNELIDAIAKSVRAGMPVSGAAAILGIAKPTVMEWLRRGEGKDDREMLPICATFAKAIEKAKHENQLERIERLRKAAEGGAVVNRKITTLSDGTIYVEEKMSMPSWQADAWYLERSDPDNWGRIMRRDPQDEELLAKFRALADKLEAVAPPVPDVVADEKDEP